MTHPGALCKDGAGAVTVKSFFFFMTLEGSCGPPGVLLAEERPYKENLQITKVNKNAWELVL